MSMKLIILPILFLSCWGYSQMLHMDKLVFPKGVQYCSSNKSLTEFDLMEIKKLDSIKWYDNESIILKLPLINSKVTNDSKKKPKLVRVNVIVVDAQIKGSEADSSLFTKNFDKFFSKPIDNTNNFSVFENKQVLMFSLRNRTSNDKSTFYLFILSKKNIKKKNLPYILGQGYFNFNKRITVGELLDFGVRMVK